MKPPSSRAQLRRSLRQQRQDLPAQQRLQASLAVAEQVLALPELDAAQHIAIYWAVRGELPLLHTVLALQRLNKAIYLPVIQPDNTLLFALWQPGQATPANAFGIPEPQPEDSTLIAPHMLDLVLVPLVAFDDAGGRLGSGAGYYDRSFAFLSEQARPAHPLLLGVGYAFQKLSSVQAQSWDIPLDAVVTDQGLLRCR